MSTANPPVECLRGTVVLTAAAAVALGSNSASIAFAVFVRKTPVGWMPVATISLPDRNEVVVDIGDAPGIAGGPVFDQYSAAATIADMKAKGTKVWIIENIIEWLNDALRKFFTGKVGSSAGSSPIVTITYENMGDEINRSLAADFGLVMDNGIPVVTAK